jgi:site-specific recombinase XerD
MTKSPHPSFAKLAASWDLSLRADAYASNTQRAYAVALSTFAAWMGETYPDVSATDVTRDHVRGFLVHVRETRSTSTARGWFAGIRHFFRFLVAEEEMDKDPTSGVKTPPAGEPHTPVLSMKDMTRLLATTAGKGFIARRDHAILRLFMDGGLRRSELTGLKVSDVDLVQRMVFVAGKGSKRSGPRNRAVPFGVKTAQALDRYLRERDRHPLASTTSALWLGDRNRGQISGDGIEAVVSRRAESVGLKVHPHMFRHTWASEFRAADGSEGDLMVLGGWRSRLMLDRYGRAAAVDRARESYQRLSLGDRL